MYLPVVALNVCLPSAGVRAGTAGHQLSCVAILHVHLHIFDHSWAHWALLGLHLVVPLLMTLQLLFSEEGLSTLSTLEIMVGFELMLLVKFVLFKVLTTAFLWLVVDIDIMPNKRSFPFELISFICTPHLTVILGLRSLSIIVLFVLLFVLLNVLIQGSSVGKKPRTSLALNSFRLR